MLLYLFVIDDVNIQGRIFVEKATFECKLWFISIHERTFINISANLCFLLFQGYCRNSIDSEYAFTENHINYQILFKKFRTITDIYFLTHYFILYWLDSYMYIYIIGLTQFIEFKNFYSPEYEVLTGVSQGSRSELLHYSYYIYNLYFVFNLLFACTYFLMDKSYFGLYMLPILTQEHW
jgi:hypothetical protein